MASWTAQTNLVVRYIAKDPIELVAQRCSRQTMTWFADALGQGLHGKVRLVRVTGQAQPVAGMQVWCLYGTHWRKARTNARWVTCQAVVGDGSYWSCAPPACRYVEEKVQTVVRGKGRLEWCNEAQLKKGLELTVF